MSERSKALEGAGFRGTHVASALFAGFLALSATYALPVVAPAQYAGSVHAKNGATPGWILDRQTQNAHQAPVIIEADEPGFWI